MSGKIKLNPTSGGGSFSLQAPSSSSNNRVFTLPDVADATMATVNGITMVDQWRITSDFTLSTSAAIMSGWERNDSTGYESIGTGMTESSGVFTFPTTGIYLVTFMGTSHGNAGASLAITAQIQTQKNSGTFATRSQSQESAYTTNAYGSMLGQTVFNVEDTSGDKLRMRVYAADSNRKLLGDTTLQRTGLTFIRLGDT